MCKRGDFWTSHVYSTLWHRRRGLRESQQYPFWPGRRCLHQVPSRKGIYFRSGRWLWQVELPMHKAIMIAVRLDADNQLGACLLHSSSIWYKLSVILTFWCLTKIADILSHIPELINDGQSTREIRVNLNYSALQRYPACPQSSSWSPGWYVLHQQL